MAGDDVTKPLRRNKERTPFLSAIGVIRRTDFAVWRAWPDSGGADDSLRRDWPPPRKPSSSVAQQAFNAEALDPGIITAVGISMAWNGLSDPRLHLVSSPE
jgi:hypothetical protein